MDCGESVVYLCPPLHCFQGKFSRDTFKPKFCAYLNDRFEMMACHMIADIREEVGKVVEDDAKPVCCYTNDS